MNFYKNIFKKTTSTFRPTKKKILAVALTAISTTMILSALHLYKIYHNNKVALTIFGTTKYTIKSVDAISKELKEFGLDAKLANSFIEEKEKLKYLTDNIPSIKPSTQELDDARKMFYPHKDKLTTVEEDEVYRNTVFYKYKALKYGSYIGTVFVFPFDNDNNTDISNEDNAKAKAIEALRGLEADKLLSVDVINSIIDDSAFEPSSTLPNPSGDFVSTDLSEETFAFEDINDGILNHKDTGYSNIEKALKPGTDVAASGAYYFYYIEPLGYQAPTKNIDAQISVVIDLLKNVKAQY